MEPSGMIDLVPAARGVSMLAVGVQDRQLDAPTPCAGKTVGDLLDHFMGLAVAFRDAATKASMASGYDDQRPGPPADTWGSGSRLDPEWRLL
ncbi:maleylpyruvate isomerase N-terminal domain-containing protein, partial [Crystallibacter crystallopoietes]